MSLKELQLAYEYRSDSTNIVDSFYTPCLSESVGYWRAVGYFTSQGLALAAKGLASFIDGGGQMRLVASPWFEPEDIEAFKKGYDARDDILELAILRQFGEELIDAASPVIQHRLGCLAWLIAEQRLDIKVACRSHNLLGIRPGIYHEKIGIFFDAQDNLVAFSGSPNETVGGLVSNFESIDVYVSWDDPHRRVGRKEANFERLWSNLTSGLFVLDFPTAAKRALLRFRPSARPEGDPETETTGKTFGQLNVPSQAQRIAIPSDISLRHYQEEACEAWMSREGQGILTMATGSGKTITALASAVRLLEKQGRLFVLVTCPFQHLVDQWADEAKQFGFRPILAYQSRQTWENSLHRRLVDYNLGNRENVFVITSHSTFIGEPMQDSLTRLKGPSLLVADEVHHLGATEGRKNLPDMFIYRMGLSATPKRWFDEQGTIALEEYFGPTVFEFPLKEAIREGCLSEYYYYPLLVELTDDEFEEYEELTKKIAQLFSVGGVPGEDPALDALLRKRASILNTASNKISALADLVSKEPNLHHALFYCVPGQIDEVTLLLGKEFGIRVHKFTVEESVEERVRLLESFANGELQALTAIRCLDEGVDVPCTQVAYLLASSSNPREFIQRRGRILRKAPGKQYATIHDMITVPSLSYHKKLRTREAFNAERRILKRELVRFREFAEASKNPFQANDVIWNIAKAYNLLDF